MMPANPRSRSWVTACVLLGLILPVAGWGADSPVERFEREVRPILVERCQGCHGPRKAEAGLRVTSRAALLNGGRGGAAVLPGDPDRSLLIRVVRYHGELRMPPTGRLPDREVRALEAWVAGGAVWPPEASSSGRAVLSREAAHRSWWAFQPVRSVTPPSDPAGSEPIDRFLLRKLRAKGLTFSPPADRRTLIRRVTYDLTGLPPTPEEVDAFLIDSSPGAYSRVVDRLLASPAYGERFARHWLDVVRYADYHDGNPQARTASCEPLQAWRYRDWVVDAFNRDLRFDQFIEHQIAGDTLPDPQGGEFYADGLVATTFLTNGSWDRGDADKEKMVSDMVDDQIDTVGKAFLGLTVGCARCHDHKFDPISQADYYGLAGMFYSTRILKDLGAKGGEYTLQRIPLASREYVARREKQLAALAETQAKLAGLDKQIVKPPPDDPIRKSLVEARDRQQKELLAEPPLAEAAQEGGTPGGLFPGIQDVPIHVRGSYTRLGEVVPRRLPEFLAGKNQRRIPSGSGRRELAKWIASPTHPLTARVIVNRVWQWHFGTGLVATPNNFGTRSERPSHPELLDWLARRLVEGGWSLKRLHREVVVSSAYRQASRLVDRAGRADPENRWLSRFPARRLEAEAIRDTLLAVAGELDQRRGGPATADPRLPRRSLYLQTARWDRSTVAMLFDAANPDASEERRSVSTVAPQALYFLNNEFVRGRARSLSERLKREVSSDEMARLQRAYQLLFARDPTEKERQLAGKFLAKRSTDSWQELAHVLLCSNELVYLR